MFQALGYDWDCKLETKTNVKISKNNGATQYCAIAQNLTSEIICKHNVPCLLSLP